MYANMSERTTQDYNEVLDRLPDLPNLEYFLVDFEFAERYAIERRYPHVQVRTLGFRTFFSFRNLKFYKKDAKAKSLIKRISKKPKTTSKPEKCPSAITL